MLTPRFDLHHHQPRHVITFVTIGWATFDGRLRAVERTLETATATLVEQVRQGAQLAAVSDRVTRLERVAETR